MTKALIANQTREGWVERFPLDLLDASPNNPRRTMDDKGLEELAASIKQSGITQPLLVRPVTWVEGLVEPRYEIVCGHRRCEAATIAGLEEAPCIVREMDDQEAAEIALIDNLQRVDVPALEEAEAFGKLLALYFTAEAVAARVGKDVAHVAKRLALRTLGAWQRDALRESLITVDHALLLARLGIEEQDAALKWCLDRNAGSKTSVDKVIAERVKVRADKSRRDHWHWEAETVLRLKEHIEQSSGRKLSRAPWSLDDVELVREAGACSTCPSNTKANTALFADLTIEAATCADGKCFERKRAAFVQIRMRTATKDVMPPVRLSWKSTAVAPRFEKVLFCKCGAGKNCKTGEGCRGVAKLDQVFKHGQWVVAKSESCANIRAGVTVDWSDDANRGYMNSGAALRKPGELLQVCIAAKCKAHKKEWEKAKAENANVPRNENSPEARAAREGKEKAADAENAIRTALIKEAIAKVKAVSGALLRRLVQQALGDWLSGEDEERFPGLIKAVETLKPESAEFARAAASALFVGNDADEFWASEWIGVEQGRKELIALLKDLGFDASKAWDKPKPEKPAPAKKPAVKVAGHKPGCPLPAAIKKAAKKIKKAGRK